MNDLWRQMRTIGEHFVAATDKLPEYLSQHILVTALALGFGIAISLPAAVVATRRAGLRYPLLTVASVQQTIPSIAMLVLVYAVMVGLNSLLLSLTGWGELAVSFISAVVALTLYSILPVLRNTVTGIQNVDPAMTEAARGMGMTASQVLFKVELPLAAPVIIAGIRTATVWVVGIATLTTPVGQTSLGDYIFVGLQLENWGMVLLGCVSAAVLAIVLDMLIALLQRASQKRSKVMAIGAVAGLAVVFGGGLTLTRAVPDHLVGAKTFDEQFILASMIRDELVAAGFDTGKRQGLGSTLAFNALAGNQIDAYVDYSGTIWAVQMQRDDVAGADEVYREVEQWLAREHGITCVGRLGFENAYALAMKRSKAEQLGIETIADLAAHAPELSIGGDYEFFDRPEWQNIKNTYGLAFGDTRRFQSTLMYQAVNSGKVDVISAFSSDGRIAAYDLRVLEDPRNAIPPYDAILLVSPKASKIEGFIEALQPLIGAIDDRMMRKANYMVDREQDKKTPAEAAAWLEAQIGGASDER